MSELHRLPGEPVMAAISACFGCGQAFMYDPDCVPSIAIDPDTGTSPELGGGPATAVRQPICPACCRAANPERKRRGFPLLPEHDTLLNPEPW